MANNNTAIENYRKQALEAAEAWLREHVLTPNSHSSPFSPYDFLKAIQYPSLSARKSETILKSDNDSEYEKIQRFEKIKISDAIRQNQKLLILGDPGYGKTTCLQYVILEYLKDSLKPIPIFIRLKHFQENQTLNRLIKSVAKLEIEIKKYQKERFIFLLDGFNEIPASETERFITELLNLLDDHEENSTFILTSRKLPCTDELVDVPSLNWRTCELVELSKKNIYHYINSTLEKKSVNELISYIEEYNLFNVVEVPLFLDCICRLKKKCLNIPKTKGGIINEIIFQSYITEKALNKVKKNLSKCIQNISPGECIELISVIAYQVYDTTGSISFIKQHLSSISKKIETSSPVWDIIELLLKLGLIEKHSVLNNNITNIVYSFKHQIIFEYFIGYYIQNYLLTAENQRQDIKPILHKYFEFHKWDEPIKMLLGICDKNLGGKIINEALRVDIFLTIKYLSVADYALTPQQIQNIKKDIQKKIHSLNTEVKLWVYSAIGYERCFILQDILCITPDDCDDCLVIGAIFSLADFRNAKALDHLIFLVNHYDHICRYQAIRGLGIIGDYRATPVLLNIINRETDLFFVTGAWESIGKVGDPGAIPFISDILKRDSSHCSAISALGNIRNQSVIPILLDVYHKQKSIDEPAICVLEALINVYKPEFKPKLSKTIKKMLYEIVNAVPLYIPRIINRNVKNNNHCITNLIVDVFIQFAESSDKNKRALGLLSLGSMDNQRAKKYILKSFYTNNIECKLITALIMTINYKKCAYQYLKSTLCQYNIINDLDITQYFNKKNDNKKINQFIINKFKNFMWQKDEILVFLETIGENHIVFLLPDLYDHSKLRSLRSYFCTIGENEASIYSHPTIKRVAGATIVKCIFNAMKSLQNATEINYSLPTTEETIECIEYIITACGLNPYVVDFISEYLTNNPQNEWAESIIHKMNNLSTLARNYGQGTSSYFLISEKCGKRFLKHNKYYSETNTEISITRLELHEELFNYVDYITNKFKSVLEYNDEKVLECFTTEYSISYTLRDGLSINGQEGIKFRKNQSIIIRELISQLKKDWHRLKTWPQNPKNDPQSIGWVSEEDLCKALPSKGENNPRTSSDITSAIRNIRNKIRPVTGETDGLIENGSKVELEFINGDEYEKICFEKHYRLRVHKECIVKKSKKWSNTSPKYS